MATGFDIMFCEESEPGLRIRAIKKKKGKEDEGGGEGGGEGVSRNTKATSTGSELTFPYLGLQVIDPKEPRARNDGHVHRFLFNISPNLREHEAAAPSATHSKSFSNRCIVFTTSIFYQNPRGYRPNSRLDPPGFSRASLAHPIPHSTCFAHDNRKGPFGFLQAKNPDGWGAPPPLYTGNQVGQCNSGKSRTHHLLTSLNLHPCFRSSKP